VALADRKGDHKGKNSFGIELGINEKVSTLWQ
jgi:hypothetical protein